MTITVGDAPVGVVMYVSKIAMVQKGPNLDTFVTIHADTNGDGVADVGEAAVADVVPKVKPCDDAAVPTCYFTNAAIATNSEGRVKYKLLKPKVDAVYTMTVIDVQDGTGSFVYDSGITGAVSDNSITIN